MAYRDALTCVSNRMRWDDLLDDRRGAGVSMGWIAAIDIDGFKRINDTKGHVAGDRALQAVAAELCAPPLGSDAVFRTGGDEFVVLIPAMDAPLATSLVRATRERVAKVLHPYGASISVGVSPISDDDSQYALRKAFTQADAALYKAKKDGGGGVHFH